MASPSSTEIVNEDFVLTSDPSSPEGGGGGGGGALSTIMEATRPVNTSTKATQDDPTNAVIQAMWHRADDMQFKERGDRDMTQEEVTDHLNSHANPFEPLPEDNNDRIAEAIRNGDLETLKQIDNVHIYQSYRDQAEEQGKDVDALEEGQLVLKSGELWAHFQALRALRKQHKDEAEWEQAIDTPKWKRFLRWYPTIFGYAATLNLAPRHIESTRFMIEQMHMHETNPNYTRAHMDAAMEYYNRTKWIEMCMKQNAN